MTNVLEFPGQQSVFAETDGFHRFRESGTNL